MFVNCLVKQFAISLVVVVILLLNVIAMLSVCGGAPCMVFQRVCVVHVIPVLVDFRPEYYIENYFILHPTHVVDVRKGNRS